MNGGNFVKKEKIYSLTVKGDNTLKTFFERFYVLPKGKNGEKLKKLINNNNYTY